MTATRQAVTGFVELVPTALAMGRDDNKAKESFSTQIYFVDGKTYTNEQLDAIEKKQGLCAGVAAVYLHSF